LRKLPVIIIQIFRLLVLALVFLLGYRFTDHFFRTHKVPYPFELFGIAAGLGFLFFAYAVMGLFEK